MSPVLLSDTVNPTPTQLWDPIVGEDQSFQMSPVAPETAPRVSWPGSCHHEVGTEVSGLGDAEKCLPSIDFPLPGQNQLLVTVSRGTFHISPQAFSHASQTLTRTPHMMRT